MSVKCGSSIEQPNLSLNTDLEGALSWFTHVATCLHVISGTRANQLMETILAHPCIIKLCEWFKQNPNIIFLHNLKPCEEISITLDDNNIWIFLNHSYMNLICLGCLIFNLVKSKPN